jgi:Family of unknown function (DUF6247)
MTSLVEQLSSSPPAPPPADPQAIRACLHGDLVGEFDSDWEFVLDSVKKSRDLTEIHSVINKWRHIAYMELRDPGSYRRMLATAAETVRTGQAPPGSISGEEMMAIVRERLRTGG